MGNVITTGSELIHCPLFFYLFFLLHTPPINLETEEVASWIKVLLNHFSKKKKSTIKPRTSPQPKLTASIARLHSRQHVKFGNLAGQ